MAIQSILGLFAVAVGLLIFFAGLRRDKLAAVVAVAIGLWLLSNSI
jgi:hypothetical protein